jgi:ABC-type lipoprotein export system ATPase subunit
MSDIRLSNIHKSYQDGEGRLNHVLRGINMDIEKGEFIAIKGPSGSGKTTLLSILGTMLQPDEGSYLLNGTEMTTPGIDYASVRNKQIGFVFQDHRLMPQYSALENILLPTLAYRQEASREEIEYAHHLLELTHITGVANQYPNQLSGGEAGRVAICRSLIMKPLLVLADEPTGQLDAENAKNIASLLSEINKNLQTTIVLVTHSNELASVANRVFTLNHGNIV